MGSRLLNYDKMADKCSAITAKGEPCKKTATCKGLCSTHNATKVKQISDLTTHLEYTKSLFDEAHEKHRELSEQIDIAAKFSRMLEDLHGVARLENDVDDLIDRLANEGLRLQSLKAQYRTEINAITHKLRELGVDV